MIGKPLLTACVFVLSSSPVLAGGFVCELTRECVNNTCNDVSYQPYIDTDWGQVVIKDFGPEISLDFIPDPAQNGSETWKMFAILPSDGLLIVMINEDYSSVFTSFGQQGGSARVVSTFGTCEPRG